MCTYMKQTKGTDCEEQREKVTFLVNTKYQQESLFNMKAFYIFIIVTSFIHINRSIEYPSVTRPCLNEPDFCKCSRLWITCDCQSGNQTTGNVFHNNYIFITIKNCRQLIVPQGSFKSGRLRVIFQDIKNLSLAAGSFETGNNGRINITISNSKLSEIPGGMLTTSHPGPRDPVQPSNVATTTIRPSLVFQMADSEIGRIASGVFANLTLHEMTITNTTIDRVDTDAINNHVQENISFINNTFVSLGRQAMVLHTSQMLVLDGNKFKGNVSQFLEGTIKGDVYIRNNSFPKLQTSPWRLRVKGDITILGNIFPFLPRHGMDITVQQSISLVENDIQQLGPEAFTFIVPEGKKAVIFMDGNLIHKQEPMSLCLNEAFPSNSVYIKHVRFQQKCDCDISNTLSRALNINNLTIKAIYKNEVHEQWFKNGECILKLQGISHISIDQFLIRSCFPHNNFIMEILLALALILVIITVCVIVAWRRMRRMESTDSSSVAGYHSYTEPFPSNTVPGSWLVVQPEPRTYQETEIHVVFDKAQEITDDDDTETNKDETGNDNIKDIKRTPSPSTRQSCPVLSLATSKS